MKYFSKQMRTSFFQLSSQGEKLPISYKLLDTQLLLHSKHRTVTQLRLLQQKTLKI
jgi:hypothetical protein